MGIRSILLTYHTAALGREFEPKIFSALQSARMMILVAHLDRTCQEAD